MNTYKRLEYYLPRLGKVSTLLYNSSSLSYEILNRFNHIDRLKKIDHLGVIRNVYEGAHHPRWEYVMLQLGLLHRLDNLVDEEGKRINRRLGLSRKKNKYIYYDPSGTEIIQIWILLLNSGHLPYTFASERAILRACENNEHLKNVLSESLPESMKDHFNRILEKEEIFSIHKVLIGFYLQYYKLNSIPRVPPFQIIFLQKILDMYLEVNPKNQNLHQIFRRIRQLSYLFLDSQYSPFPLDFDISKIFLNFNDYVTDLFIKQNSQISKTLDSFDDFLSVNMYHSADTIREFGHHTKIMEKRLETANIRTADTFYQFLKNDKNFKLDNYDWKNSPNFHVFFDLSPYLEHKLIMECFNNELSMRYEHILKRHYDDNLCELTFHKSPSLKHMVMTLACNTESLKDNTKIISTFLEDIIEIYVSMFSIIYYQLNNAGYDKDIPEEYKDLDINEIEKYERLYNALLENIFQDVYKELVSSTLEYLIDGEVFIDFKDKDVKNSIIPIKPAFNDFEDIIGKTQKRMKSPADSSRWHELETLKCALKDLNTELPYPFLLSLSSILIYNSQKDLAEIDGFALGIQDNNLKLLLMEAKDQQGGANIAMRALENKFEEGIAFKGNFNLDINKINDSRARGAYCCFKLDE